MLFILKHNNKNMDALFDRQDAMTKEVAIDGKRKEYNIHTFLQ